MTNKERQMYDLIKKGWCKGAMARDRDGREVSIGDPSATQFCLVGAGFKVSLSGTSYIKLARIIDSYTHWNDAKGRTKRQVLAMLRKAWN